MTPSERAYDDVDYFIGLLSIIERDCFKSPLNRMFTAFSNYAVIKKEYNDSLDYYWYLRSIEERESFSNKGK